MNAPSFSEPRDASSSRQMSDEKMEQIRDLLFGDFSRESEARLILLETKVRDLELALNRRLEAMQARLDALSAEKDATQRQAIDEIAHGMQDLGERIKNISFE